MVRDDDLDRYRAKLMAIVTARPLPGVSRAVAQLDAAELLLEIGAHADQRAVIRAELEAALDGDRCFETEHVVRAIRVLIGAA